ncbi:hypothetical protein Ctob_007014 [Chrysochromulina tobinii]|uniref:Uncharacterized protein n=1 Tax=Chrysochromulina tobinii TaxID=1460289 RepID=A0A0M0JDD8_9EUKA|nr:hypothetical protein Ctob_007014 [Chrysochromulina tobinii]|eukprot:KOO24586.1 hypothetical protein Ctob_007014 [Chrysochromulina sp. CCMP291]
MADDASKGIDFGPTTHIDLGPRRGGSGRERGAEGRAHPNALRAHGIGPTAFAPRNGARSGAAHISGGANAATILKKKA